MKDILLGLTLLFVGAFASLYVSDSLSAHSQDIEMSMKRDIDVVLRAQNANRTLELEQNNRIFELFRNGEITRDDLENSLALKVTGIDPWPVTWITNMDSYQLEFDDPGCEVSLQSPFNATAGLPAEWKCPMQPDLSIQCMVKVVIDAPLEYDAVDGTYYYLRACDGEFIVTKPPLFGGLIFEVHYNSRFYVAP